MSGSIYPCGAVAKASPLRRLKPRQAPPQLGGTSRRTAVRGQLLRVARAAAAKQKAGLKATAASKTKAGATAASRAKARGAASSKAAAAKSVAAAKPSSGLRLPGTIVV